MAVTKKRSRVSVSIRETKPPSNPRSNWLLWLLSKTDTLNLKNFCEELDLDDRWLAKAERERTNVECIRKHLAVARAAGVDIEEYFDRFVAEA